MPHKIVRFLMVGAFVMTAGLASAAETVTYTYDAKGRLISVSHSGTVNNTIVATYAFDAAGNRKLIKVTGAP